MQPPRVLPERVPRAKQSGARTRERLSRTKLILCVLPRRLRVNPLTPLLSAYQVAGAATATEILRLARKQAYDGYIVHSPLGWLEAAEACRRIRVFDAHTPLIVYAAERSVSERKDVIAAGAHAYVARSDDVHNLPGTAGQLIMLAELRSMDAMSARGHAMLQKLVARLGQLRQGTNAESTINSKSEERLKLEAHRLFADAGGSRANFERLWPSIYANALRHVGQPQA
ncbi:MAG: Response regulator receiver domain [Betaproteobacteria bacterium]|jgi:DNA-binding NarL/FixJ family response regulator|nr:Response regulator receiver domain [Betaproteobacteria bacterium]